jgi:FkbM family methyltransferase
MPPTVATIIHLGAGEGARLQEFRDRGTRQIVLLEPAAEAAKALESRVAGCRKTRVINAAAATRDGQGDLHVWNLARLNSLVPVSPQMHDLYPGLRQRSQQTVRLLSPRRLLAEIGEIERPLLLVVETPGSEREALEGWKADGLIEQIDQIELHCAEEALYEGAATRAELEAWLAEQGFEVAARDRDDPDWTVLHMRADHAARALKRAEAEIAEHLETISQQAKALEEGKVAFTQVSERAEALEKTLAEREAALAEVQAQAEKHAARLKAEEAAHAQAYEERDKAVADLGLALRMQGLLQSDLEDLRERYRRSEETRASQEALLRKLTPRLQEAAHQLRQLQLVGEVDAAPTLAPAPQAATGSPARDTAHKRAARKKSADGA